MKIILASKSPRRRKMFEDLKIPFEVFSADTDENIDTSLPPEMIVKELAKRKAESASRILNESDHLVIGSDTVVYGNGIILGKPENDAHAFEMLKSLSDKEHYVYSGVCAVYNGKTVCDFEKTTVKFRPISDREIEKYIATGEHRDKAGSYGIQENGGYFVEYVNGDINNVVGMPVYKLRNMVLSSFGIDLFDM